MYITKNDKIPKRRCFNYFYLFTLKPFVFIRQKKCRATLFKVLRCSKNGSE